MHTEIQDLIDGYARFRQQYLDTPDTPFKKLIQDGQRPKILMIACSDSRVDPALLLNCQPGDLFVIRNVANLVPPYENDSAYHGTSSALEFGVCTLEVEHIILLGHTPCGGLSALLQSEFQFPPATFLAHWLELAKDAQKATLQNPQVHTLQEKLVLCSHYSLIHSLENLQTFPWIVEKIKAQKLHLHAWNFDMEQGILEAYIPDQGLFQNLHGTT